jgi:hypothetical protein
MRRSVGPREALVLLVIGMVIVGSPGSLTSTGVVKSDNQLEGVDRS